MSLATRIAETLRGTRPAEPRPIARWATARATTADGVVTDLSVDLVLRPLGSASRGPDDEHAALDAIEDALRRLITGAGVHDLPVAGDTLAAIEGTSVAGHRVEQATVTAAEVSVTPELHRLVAGRGGGSAAWT